MTSYVTQRIEIAIVKGLINYCISKQYLSYTGCYRYFFFNR